MKEKLLENGWIQESLQGPLHFTIRNIPRMKKNLIDIVV